jgi:predicted ATP-grasp superfamily ATP-dependent carboligase
MEVVEMNMHATMAVQKTALLLGNYRPAIAVARALDAMGYAVIVGNEGDEGGTEWSRSVSELWPHPALSGNARQFMSALDQLLKARSDISIVVPINEEFAIFFAAHHWQAPHGVILASPDAHIVQKFSSKMTALALARQQNVATLPFQIASNHHELVELSAAIGYPMTVRALGDTARINGQKALILNSEQELLAALPVWPRENDKLLLQAFAVGTRHNIYFAAYHGELVGACESRIARTNTPDGTGLAVKGQTTRVSAALLQQTSNLIAKSGYTGIGIAQFIVDPETKNSCFLELNPRISGSHAVPEAAGVPLTRWAVEMALGQFVKPDQMVIGRPGLRYVWTSGELTGIKIAFKRRQISAGRAFIALARAIKDAFVADVHFIWSFDDPVPAIRAMLMTIPKFDSVRKLLRQRIFKPATNPYPSN